MSSSTEHGVLLLNKQSGFTSFDSLNEVKRAFNTGKVGHTGTLDKFATGLLVVLVGRAVKLAPLFSNASKEYRATVQFGTETDTLDPEGKVIGEAPVPKLEDVEAAFAAFRGEIQQAPPAYSAIHIDGQRAHELTRKGIAVEMKQRPVSIHSLELLSWTPPEAVLHVHCSSGTYIRSLARDIAHAVNSRAHLCALVRTKVGNFRLEDSVSSNDRNVTDSLLPLDAMLFQTLALPVFSVDAQAAIAFMHGKPLRQIVPQAFAAIQDGAETAEAAGVFKRAADGEAGELIGILKRNKGINGKSSDWTYAHVFQVR